MENLDGRLDIFIGCMFSGKSISMLRKLHLLADLGLKVIYVNHEQDTRSTDDFSSHQSNVHVTIPTKKIRQFNDHDFSIYDVIGIDEANFFDRDLIDFVIDMLNKEKYIIVTGLDGTFDKKPFGHIFELIPHADNVVKLHAYCMDCLQDQKVLRPGIFSKRIVSGNDQVIVGGKESYKAVCRKCFRGKE